jgi:hypothetical protein
MLYYSSMSIESIEDISKPVELSKEGIPLEFEEIPEGFVPVFITVKPESIDYIGKYGFRTQDNQMMSKKPEIEDLLTAEAKKKGLHINHSSCVFAAPEPPEEEGDWFFFNPYDPNSSPLFAIEALVNPENALVADSNLYVLIEDYLFFNEPEKAAETAKYYWGNAILLKDYLNTKQKPKMATPKTLIFQDIPLKNVRLVHSPSN